MDIIKTDRLTKYYGKARGITDLDLTVKEGEFFGFIGPNGAGKSTTIRTLLGLITPHFRQGFGIRERYHKRKRICFAGYRLSSLGSIVLWGNEGKRCIETVRRFA